MRSWTIKPCTVADAAALARNNIAAFWEDSSWNQLWPKEIQLQFLIEQSAMRQPRNLLRNRELLRHEKAVDSFTGEIIGYARWALPTGASTDADGRPEWPEAQVPAVGKDEETRFEVLAESAWWYPKSEMSHMDDEINAIAERILSEKNYLQLDYLAVDPEQKGKGIATALVQSGIRFAEKAELPVFTIAFNAARGVYTRLGFKEIHSRTQDISQYGGVGVYTTYFMVRDVLVM